MSDPPSPDRYSAEALRLAGVLSAMVKEEKVSVRSLEQKMQVGDSVFGKVLKGKITLQVRHILLICDALGIEWKDFFARAYGPAALAASGSGEDKLKAMVVALMVRAGLLTPEAGKKLLAEETEAPLPEGDEPPPAGEP